MDFYDLDSLSRALDTFEQRYGLSSKDFFRGHRHDGATVSEIPGFDRHLWASLYLGRSADEWLPHYGRLKSLEGSKGHPKLSEQPPPRFAPLSRSGQLPSWDGSNS